MDIKLTDYSFRYMIDCDYDEDRDCKSNFCDCICRCTTLENVRISDDEHLGTYLVEKIINNLKSKNPKTGRWVKYKCDNIERYCIERLACHYGLYDKENFDIDVVSGYYGQEIGNITFDNHKQLTTEIINLLKMNDVDKVKLVLEKEYMFLIDAVKDCKSVRVSKENVLDVVKNNMEITRIKKSGNTGYIRETDLSFPIGVITENKLLIDGHNRSVQALEENIDKANFVVLE